MPFKISRSRPSTPPQAKQRAHKCRNGGTWTEARFWQAIRSTLRRSFRYWKPGTSALNAVRVAKPGPHGAKWAYRCARCTKLYRRDGVQIEHKIPCGTLKRYEDIVPFLQRLTPESPEAFQVLCKTCHKEKTQQEKVAREYEVDAY